jgi:starch phosphorylase
MDKQTTLAQPGRAHSELTVEAIKADLLDHLFYSQGTLPETATSNDWYLALAHTVRDRLLDRWIQTVRTLMRSDVKVVAYLSAEFLIGPQLGNNLINLGIYDRVRQAT